MEKLLHCFCFSKEDSGGNVNVRKWNEKEFHTELRQRERSFLCNRYNSILDDIVAKHSTNAEHL